MQDANENIRKSRKSGLAKGTYLGIQVLQNPVTPKKVLSCFMIWESGK
jgi:hypothetical protein